MKCKVKVAGRVGLGAQTAPLSFHWYWDKWRDFSVAHFFIPDWCAAVGEVPLRFRALSVEWRRCPLPDMIGLKGHE